ncbi:hypothetical protein DFJ75_3456 [Williamsia muralis]|uniref:Uncharacterized protein n=1 Tax=Williamsia marianensis TaxID=85044 RepID=A0A495K5M7_WILMA|nr:hypothetical protein [Williamsia muralis]RKR96603.1 hypothetical protein DFJ75_3456 [Williamsia muralis]
MAAVTVFIAPHGTADGVLSALTDLSAAALVDPFVWVAESATTDAALTVHEGRAYDTTVQQVLSTQRIDLLRICVLVPLVGGPVAASSGQERRISDLLASTSGGARIVRVRCLIARPGTVAAQSPEVLDGWHNILIAPEDAQGPGMGHIQLDPSTDPVEIGRHSAPAVASLLGLWAGLDHRPLDSSPVLPGQVIRLARSFYRKLDTSAAEDSLRAQVLAQNGSLPLPSDQRSTVVYIQDVALAARTMSDSLWHKFSSVLHGPRMPYEAEGSSEIGVWAAIKMFFSFMGAALRNAPSAWYNQLVDGVSTGIASTVHKTIFGAAPSAYDVVARGRTPEGGLADWTEIGSASGQLSSVLADPSEGRTHHNASADLSNLWQDYARAALTLADGGARSADLTPVQVGANRGIISRSADVVPGPAQRFTRLSGIVGATIGVDGVDATDALGIMQLRQMLSEQEQNANFGLEARRAASDLDNWRRETSGSFGVQVGRRLADSFVSTFGEVQNLLQRLRDAQAPPPQPTNKHGKLARVIQFAALLFVLVAALLVWLVVRGSVDWWLAAAIFVVILVVAVVVGATSFIRSQRDLFQQLKRRKSVVSQQEVDRQNLRTGLRDLERLSQAYSQYLSWSRALGTFLAQPLGPDTATSKADPRVAWGLPMSVAVGSARPVAEQVSTTAEYVRQDLFGLGWLTESWEGLVDNAAPAAGRAESDVDAEVSRLWTAPGHGSGSPLDRWSSALFNGTITSTGADLVWNRARTNLMGPKAELVQRLVGTVDIPAVGTDRSVNIADFLCQIDRQTAPTGNFDRKILTDLAATSGAAEVKDDIRTTARNGIGIVCAATQLSGALSLDNLTLDARPRADFGWNEQVPEMPSEHRAQVEPRTENQRFAPPTMGDGLGF